MQIFKSSTLVSRNGTAQASFPQVVNGGRWLSLPPQPATFRERFADDIFASASGSAPFGRRAGDAVEISA